MDDNYVLNTGKAIVRRLRQTGPIEVPAIIVAGHAPLTWGRDVFEAARHAVILESAAKLAYLTMSLNGQCRGLQPTPLDLHFNRKHGSRVWSKKKAMRRCLP